MFVVVQVRESTVYMKVNGELQKMPLNRWRDYVYGGRLCKADPLEMLGVAGGDLLDP